jgi:hypothetical protein
VDPSRGVLLFDPHRVGSRVVHHARQKEILAASEDPIPNDAKRLKPVLRSRFFSSRQFLGETDKSASLSVTHTKSHRHCRFRNNRQRMWLMTKLESIFVCFSLLLNRHNMNGSFKYCFIRLYNEEITVNDNKDIVIPLPVTLSNSFIFW